MHGLLLIGPSSERNQPAQWQYAPGKPFNSRRPSSPRGKADLPHRRPFLQVAAHLPGQGPVAPLATSIGDVAAIGG